MLPVTWLLALFASGSYARPSRDSGLTVQAPSGTFRGIINGTTPNVRQFLSVPYALPPTGERRWQPPQKRPANTTTVTDASEYPLSCSQYIQSAPWIYGLDVPEWLVQGPGQNSTAGQYARSSGENCLYVGIWTPAGRPKKLPVIIFLTGGAFVTGGIDIEYQIPQNWVQRTQSHIVVTTNYRMNIMGFPNSAGLEENNLGLLDQRAAMEWVRDNIEAFGGDPEKITLWGQSAGGFSTEIQSFYKPEDPVVKGYVMNSGNIGLGIISAPANGANFSYVASQVGCGNATTPAAELACMKTVPVESLVTIAQGTPDIGLAFYPVRDDRLVFSNFTQRFVDGQYAQLPAIYSSTTNDGIAAVPYPADRVAGPDQRVVDATTNVIFKCPARTSAQLRSQRVDAVYRYEFAGNFSTTSPTPWLGAYHDVDLAHIFGTFGDFRGPATDYQIEVSETLQDYVLAFMRDPEGLGDEVGWPPASEEQLVRIGRPSGPTVETIPFSEIDGGCTA
ncbi:Carboxylesterase-like protein 18 [Elsinoe fawcettii]|nr:Carboxylesterase-like protein 18 [Elsinoe fawcettii]